MLIQKKKMMEETLQKIDQLTANMDGIHHEVLNVKLQNERNKIPQLIETIDRMEADIANEEQRRLQDEASEKKRLEKEEQEKKAKLQEEARLRKETLLKMEAEREARERAKEAARRKEEAIRREKAAREEEERVKEEALIKEETDLRDAARLKSDEASALHTKYVRLSKESKQLYIDALQKEIKRVSGKVPSETLMGMYRSLEISQRELRNQTY